MPTSARLPEAWNISGGMPELSAGPLEVHKLEAGGMPLVMPSFQYHAHQTIDHFQANARFSERS